VSDRVTREELISITIDKYTDLQRIKRANGDCKNEELEYQIKVTVAKLSSPSPEKSTSSLPTPQCPALFDTIQIP